MNKEKDLKPIWVYLVAFFGVQFLAGIVIGAMYPNNTIDKINELTGVITFTAYFSTFLILFILYHKQFKEKLAKITKKDIIIIVVVAAITIALNELLSTLFTNFDVDMKNQEAVVAAFERNKTIMFAAVVIFAPIVEELVFRYSFSTFIKNQYAFVIISSLIFGLMHSTGIAIIVYFVLGLCLSLIYLKTNKNIISSIIVHILNNLFAILTLSTMLR